MRTFTLEEVCEARLFAYHRDGFLFDGKLGAYVNVMVRYGQPVRLALLPILQTDLPGDDWRHSPFCECPVCATERKEQRAAMEEMEREENERDATLAAELHEHEGKWVAVRDGHVIAAAAHVRGLEWPEQNNDYHRVYVQYVPREAE